MKNRWLAISVNQSKSAKNDQLSSFKIKTVFRILVRILMFLDRFQGFSTGFHWFWTVLEFFLDRGAAFVNFLIQIQTNRLSTVSWFSRREIVCFYRFSLFGTTFIFYNFSQKMDSKRNLEQMVETIAGLVP